MHFIQQGLQVLRHSLIKMHGNTKKPTNLVLNKPAVVSSPYRTTLRKHRRIEQNCLTNQAFTLLNSYSQIFSLFPSGSDSVPYSKFLCHVFRQAISLKDSPVLAPFKWQRHRGHAFRGLLFAWRTLLSLILVDHSTGKNHETMKRRQIHRILRHRSIFRLVHGEESAPVERHLHKRKQPRTRNKILPNPQFLFNFEAQSCRKAVKTF